MMVMLTENAKTRPGCDGLPWMSLTVPCRPIAIDYRSRSYNPEIGRFNRLDPHPGVLTNPLSLNKYAYAEGDPIQNVDPSGEISLVGTLVNAGLRAGLISLLISAPFRAIAAAHDLAAGASLRDVALDFGRGLLFDFAIGAVLGGGGAGIARVFGSNAFKIRAAGQAIGNFRALRLPNSVWRLEKFARGLRIEKTLLSRPTAFLGQQIRNFPVIDDFIVKGGRGIATSIKSLDLTRASYQTAAGLRSQLNRYARKLAAFTGDASHGVRIGTPHGGPAITDKILVVAFEQGSATSVQAKALVQWSREIATKIPDIKVVVQFIP
ncbi:hypothetical protein HED60_21415 [Planctomycetales bacterium ZRK34]|nr:hypothetical protein HED60_21415 [Planctomycetales bacterium ZRK34]